jgi:hypothetical protein
MNVSRTAAEQERLIAMLEPSIGRLAARGILRSYRKNTILLNEGEPGDSLFVLLQGQVKVYATDENGREITYGTIVAGDYFGEMSLDGGARSASVMWVAFPSGMNVESTATALICAASACICSGVSRTTSAGGEENPGCVGVIEWQGAHRAWTISWAWANETGAAPGVAVTVFDAVGRLVLTLPADANGTAALALPAGFATGVYVVRVGSKVLRLTVE